MLVVPCGVCPKMCLTAELGRPFFDPLGFLANDCFADHISRIRKSLADKGIRTGLFQAPFHANMMCLWPAKVRERLSHESADYEAVAVIGCESAVASVSGSVGLPEDAIVPMALNEGIANFTMETRLPFRVWLTVPPRKDAADRGKKSTGSSSSTKKK